MQSNWRIAFIISLFAFTPTLAVADSITGWKKDPVLLRTGPTVPDGVMRAIKDLPPNAEIAIRTGDFLQFYDPKTKSNWYVNRHDVTTSAKATESTLSAWGDHGKPCQQ